MEERTIRSRGIIILTVIQFGAVLALLGALIWQATINVELAREHLELRQRLNSLEERAERLRRLFPKTEDKAPRDVESRSIRPRT